MSKMKSLLALYAIGMAMGDQHYVEHKEKESEEERKQRLDKAEIERNKANGLTQFFYGVNTLWALNQKSADKKAKRKNWVS